MKKTDSRTPVLRVLYPMEAGVQESPRLRRVLDEALSGIEHIVLTSAEETEKSFSDDMSGGPVLFVLALGSEGINLEAMRLLRVLRRREDLLEGCIGGIISDCGSELYTKSAAREMVFAANSAGCTFVGRPLTEGTESLSNFDVLARTLETDNETAYAESARALVTEILTFGLPESERVHFLGSAENGAFGNGVSKAEDSASQAEASSEKKKKKLLVLHASVRKTSNTLALWQKTAELLPEYDIREISLQNGTLYDCAGCPYSTCLHFGERGSCFYGGVIAEEVYPAVREADAIVMLCANYNDALAANLTAFINRLTALFRQVRFYDKALFAVVVSGYSGSDIVAEQLISALNMNKTFYLPAHFALLTTANNAGTAVRLPGIDEKIRFFADTIRKTLDRAEDL